MRCVIKDVIGSRLRFHQLIERVGVYGHCTIYRLAPCIVAERDRTLCFAARFCSMGSHRSPAAFSIFGKFKGHTAKGIIVFALFRLHESQDVRHAVRCSAAATPIMELHVFVRSDMPEHLHFICYSQRLVSAQAFVRNKLVGIGQLIFLSVLDLDLHRVGVRVNLAFLQHLFIVCDICIVFILHHDAVWIKRGTQARRNRKFVLQLQVATCIGQQLLALCVDGNSIGCCLSILVVIHAFLRLKVRPGYGCGCTLFKLAPLCFVGVLLRRICADIVPVVVLNYYAVDNGRLHVRQVFSLKSRQSERQHLLSISIHRGFQLEYVFVGFAGRCPLFINELADTITVIFRSSNMIRVLPIPLFSSRSTPSKVHIFQALRKGIRNGDRICIGIGIFDQKLEPNHRAIGGIRPNRSCFVTKIIHTITDKLAQIRFLRLFRFWLFVLGVLVFFPCSDFAIVPDRNFFAILQCVCAIHICGIFHHMYLRNRQRKKIFLAVRPIDCNGKGSHFVLIICRFLRRIIVRVVVDCHRRTEFFQCCDSILSAGHATYQHIKEDAFFIILSTNRGKLSLKVFLGCIVIHRLPVFIRWTFEIIPYGKFFIRVGCSLGTCNKFPLGFQSVIRGKLRLPHRLFQNFFAASLNLCRPIGIILLAIFANINTIFKCHLIRRIFRHICRQSRIIDKCILGILRTCRENILEASLILSDITRAFARLAI